MDVMEVRELVFLACALAGGIVLGSVLVWLVMRNKTRQAVREVQSQGELQKSILAERLRAREEKIEELKKEVSEGEEAVYDLQNKVTPNLRHALRRSARLRRKNSSSLRMPETSSLMPSKPSLQRPSKAAMNPFWSLHKRLWKNFR